VAALQPPPITRLAWEALSGRELGRLVLSTPSLRSAPRGSAAVVVLPGFGADDASTLPLRAFLGRLGHQVQGWSLGRNRGDVPDLVPKVADAVLDLASRRGERVHLVGQSLGGVVARETAREHPEAVAQVITFGTPVVGGPAYTRLAFTYPRDRMADVVAEIDERNRIPIAVPITAVHSHRDGIVAWQACIDSVNPQAVNVEVSSSHLGMGLDPRVWRLVADRLAAVGVVSTR